MELNFLKIFLIASFICILPIVYNLVVIRFNEYFNEYITTFCKDCVLGDYKINKDKSVDVNGDVIIKFSRVKKIPFKFNNVYGDFIIVNSDFNTLRNCPNFVKNNFLINDTKITNLKYVPNMVEGCMIFSDNKLLESLDGLEKNTTIGKQTIDNGLYEIYLRDKIINEILN